MIVNGYYVFSLILCVGSAIQLGDYVISRFVPPLLSLLLALSFLALSTKYKNDFLKEAFIVHFISLLMLYICVSIGTPTLSSYIFDVIKLFLPFGLSYCTISLLSRLDHNDKHNIILSTIVCSLLVLIVEVYFRLQSVDFNIFELLGDNFYNLKKNSIFFVDSNAVGLYAVCYFSLFIYFFDNYLERKVSCLFFIGLSLYIFLILLTFSRAAIMAAILLIVYSFYLNMRPLVRYFLWFIALLFIVAFIHELMSIIGNDGSGGTKIGIYATILSKFGNYDIANTLFGFGINDGNYIYSYEEGEYSHVLLGMLLGQVGLIGCFIYIVYFSFMCFMSNYRVLFVLIPMFIAGLSYLHPFYETVFVVSAIMSVPPTSDQI